MGSVAVRAIAQNCRCMRVIQVVLIKCMMAKESDIDDLEAQQEHVLCVCEACFRISLFCDTSYRQLVLKRATARRTKKYARYYRMYS